MHRLNLLVLRCSDIDASKQFYERFGMTFTKHVHGNGPTHHAAEDETGVFELYPATAANSKDGTGLGFAIEDFDVAFQQFKDLAPQTIKENTWGRSFVVRDPDGRRVELTERR